MTVSKDRLDRLDRPATPAPSRAGSLLAGVRTVAEQEFRLRIRAGRWRWLLGIWFGVVLVFALLLRLGIDAVTSAGDSRPVGPTLFGGVLLFVLGLALLVVPALTAQSINGDRERGTLATLQVTRLTAAQIALGKLAAAWGTAVVFLALTLPIAGWAMVEGGLPLVNVVSTLLVVALLLGVVCALAQCLSAVFARSITSALMSYVTVFALTVGTLIAFGLATALTSEQATVYYRSPAVDPETGRIDPDGPVTRSSYTTTRVRPDRTWPLLAPNPFVVLADSAPALPERLDPRTGERVPETLDPLGELGNAIREARRPPRDGQRFGDTAPDGGGPVWPYGLAFDVLLGVGAVIVTVRRLRTPVHRLPRGVRIA